MLTTRTQILVSGLILPLVLSGFAFGKSDPRPASLGGEPRAEAERSLELMKLFDDAALANLGLKQEQLAQTVIGKDSVLVYHVPVDYLKKYGKTDAFGKALVNGFTVIFPVENTGNREPITSITVQQLKKNNKWVVTRYGNANLMRSMDATRRAFIELKGTKKGYYAVMVPSLKRYYVASDTGQEMTMLHVEGDEWHAKRSKWPKSASETFKAMLYEMDSTAAE